MYMCASRIVHYGMLSGLRLQSVLSGVRLTALNPAPDRQDSKQQFIRKVGLDFLIKVGASHSVLGRCFIWLVSYPVLARAEHVGYWLMIMVSCWFE